MILPGVTLTPALAAWLRAAHDDGHPELKILAVNFVPLIWYDYPAPATYHIVSGDAHNELSETEQIEVRALLAAHEAEPLKMPAAE